MSDPVLNALRAALEAEPGNTRIRLMVVERLIEAKAGPEALGHCQTLLQSEPDSGVVLAFASQAAQLAGDERLAGKYKTLSESLGGKRAESLLAGIPDPDPSGANSDAPLDLLDDEAEPSPFDIERPTITLRDVVGMTAVKRQIDMNFLAPIRQPELSKQFGVEARGGLMLFGPPGCGKTHVARALAGELGAKFLPVRIDMILGPYVGQSERALHELMQFARRNAPCVVFFDELDGLGHKRSNLALSASRTLPNQILSELDGAQFDNRGLFFLGATNHPWDVDSAFKRPGRFDRSLLVLPPDRLARKGILQQAIAGKPVTGVDLDKITERTEGYSAADLVMVVRTAAATAFHLAMEAPTGDRSAVTGKHFQSALKEVRPSTRAWFETARNFAVYANQDGSLDELVTYLKQQKIL